jgi:hypothetical protein
MKRLVFLTALGVGGAVALRRLVSPERRERISQLPTAMRGRAMERMARMMEEMPEDFPPKVFMSTMRRLQEQNEELLALMREQNDLLREQLATGKSSAAA